MTRPLLKIVLMSIEKFVTCHDKTSGVYLKRLRETAHRYSQTLSPAHRYRQTLSPRYLEKFTFSLLHCTDEHASWSQFYVN